MSCRWFQKFRCVFRRSGEMRSRCWASGPRLKMTPDICGSGSHEADAGSPFFRGMPTGPVLSLPIYRLDTPRSHHHRFFLNPVLQPFRDVFYTGTDLHTHRIRSPWESLFRWCLHDALHKSVEIVLEIAGNGCTLSIWHETSSHDPSEIGKDTPVLPRYMVCKVILYHVM